MSLRITHPTPIAAAKAGFSTATAYRCEADPRLPSHKALPRTRRRRDPLAGIWETAVVPMLKTAPGLHVVGVFEEISGRHPYLAPGVRRILERRVRAAAWRPALPRSHLVHRRRAALEFAGAATAAEPHG